jgi:hypothetical protein
VPRDLAAVRLGGALCGDRRDRLFGFGFAGVSLNNSTGTISNAIGAYGETYNKSTGTMGIAEGLEADSL